MKIIFATSNVGKLKEIAEIMKGLEVEVISMNDAGICIDIEETGTTYDENAIIKAKAIMEITGEIAMADDSGLEVDFLNKAPGVYSARFMGEDTSYEIKNQYILDQLKDVTGDLRSARYVCVIACAFPTGEIVTKRAVFEGFIANEKAGNHGFAYDPIFYVPEYQCTAAQMSMKQKNEISHRGKALRAMRESLKEYILRK